RAAIHGHVGAHHVLPEQVRENHVPPQQREPRRHEPEGREDGRKEKETPVPHPQIVLDYAAGKGKAPVKRSGVRVLGPGAAFERFVVRSGASASGSASRLPMVARPFETVIALASAPPTKKPRWKTWRISRTSYMSFQMKLSRIALSYDESALAGVSPRWSARN